MDEAAALVRYADRSGTGSIPLSLWLHEVLKLGRFGSVYRGVCMYMGVCIWVCLYGYMYMGICIWVCICLYVDGWC